MRRLLALSLLLSLWPAALASANTSHKGWPTINGMLLLNKTDTSRPLDGRPGLDPFAHQDPRYSCDAIHLRGACQRRLIAGPTGMVVTSAAGHNELLGGHGSDTIYGGPGRDFIYASHGRNTIAAGAGDDWIKAHFGSGSIDCGPGNDLLFISRRAQRQFQILNCERISHRTLGF